MLGLIISVNLHGQDPTFSQLYANRLYLNPAFAGIENDIRRVFINYRNQWPGLGNTFVTYSASYDQYIDHLKGGVGIRIMNDVQGNGSISQLSMNLIYAYHFNVTRHLMVSGGLEAGYNQRRMDFQSLRFEDQILSGHDPFKKTQENLESGRAIAYPDFKTGVAAFYRNYYAGVSMAHLTRPSQSYSSDPNSRLPRKLMIYAGGMIPVYEKRFGREVLQLSPNIIFLKQKSFTQIMYGMEGLFKEEIIAGAWLRQNLGFNFSSLIFSAGYVTKQFRFRYSYDQHLSSPSISLPVMGAHEVSLIMTIDSEKKKKKQAIKCPKI